VARGVARRRDAGHAARQPGQAGDAVRAAADHPGDLPGTGPAARERAPYRRHRVPHRRMFGDGRSAPGGRAGSRLCDLAAQARPAPVRRHRRPHGVAAGGANQPGGRHRLPVPGRGGDSRRAPAQHAAIQAPAPGRGRHRSSLPARKQARPGRRRLVRCHSAVGQPGRARRGRRHGPWHPVCGHHGSPADLGADPRGPRPAARAGAAPPG
jgi:hypothetical protein